jgi:uncharacterized membrane protein
MRWSVEQAMAHWRREGVITAKKEVEMRESLSDADNELPSRAIRVFSAVGGILVGLGVILFVASNWAALTPVVKTALLLIGMLATGVVGYWLAYEKEGYDKTGLGILFVNAMIFGASIFLVGQIYHLPLTFWWGMGLWFLGTAFMAYVLQSKLHAFLAVPLLVLAIGWLKARSVTGFDELGVLFDERVNVLGAFPAMGVTLIALGVLHRKSERVEFASDILFYWGLFLLLVPLVVSTAAREAFLVIIRFPFDSVGIGILLAAFASLVAASLFGEFRTKQGRGALIALPLYLIFVYVLAHVPSLFGITREALWYAGADSIPMLSALHVLHIILVFVLLLVIVWEGTLLRQSGMINLGIAGIGITVVIQYFSWVFELMDRSLAFIVGGVVILAVSALLERKRRALLVSVRKR